MKIFKAASYYPEYFLTYSCREKKNKIRIKYKTAINQEKKFNSGFLYSKIRPIFGTFSQQFLFLLTNEQANRKIFDLLD